MAEICRFYGIIIRMFHREHLPPHFHAAYGEYEAIISIHSPAIIHGNLPPRALGLVVEWATIHKEELEENWIQAGNFGKLRKIEPLK